MDSLTLRAQVALAIYAGFPMDRTVIRSDGSTQTVPVGTPQQAFDKADEFLSAVAEVGEGLAEEPVDPIDSLSVRSARVLRSLGVSCVEDLSKVRGNDVLGFHGAGMATLNEIRAWARGSGVEMLPDLEEAG